jgi:hypothetical protein
MDLVCELVERLKPLDPDEKSGFAPGHARYRIDEVKDQFYQEVFERGRVIYAK